MAEADKFLPILRIFTGNVQLFSTTVGMKTMKWVYVVDLLMR